MKKIILVFIIFSITYANSQEQVGGFNLELKNPNFIQKSFSVYNNYTKNTATFLFEDKRIYAYLLNEKLTIKKQLVLIDLKKRYNVLVGKMYDSNNNYKLIIANKEKNKFALIKFKFYLNETSVIEEELDAKNLLFLQSVNKGDTSHLFFLEKKTSNIISKNYFINGKNTASTFNVGKETFLINDKKEISLKKLLADYKKPDHRKIKNIEYELTKITENPYKNNVIEKVFSYDIKQNQLIPTSIELTSRYNKLYVKNNEIIITLDKNRFYTQILSLNLNNCSYIFEKIKKPLFNKKKMFKKSNSFIYDDNIFLISASKDSLISSIYSLKDKREIKRIEVGKNQPITFKNSSIIQEGGAFKKHRNFEQTNKFLRKVSESNIGIGVFKNKNGYEITIGSEKLALKGSSTILMLFSMNPANFTTDLSSSESFSSPNSNSFFNYLITKSIRIHCLFDKDFNHIKGEIEDNIYDKIAEFIKIDKNENVDDIYQNDSEYLKHPKAINLFKRNNEMILGFYLPIKKEYAFYKFN